jgi:drug/metabolite transporter (DMT)-like permease
VVSFPAMPSSRVQPEPVGVAPSEAGARHVAAAFTAVYVIWGSTYLGIRWAIETTPPLLMASVRFLVAGSLLYAWCRGRGAPRPTRAQWRAGVVAGALMLGGGNGAVSLAERWIPSGMAALLVASVPLWMVLVDMLFGSRARPSRRAAAGLLVGFAGVAVLGGSPEVGGGGGQEVVGALLILAGCASWAVGSIYLRGVSPPARPLMWVSMQMLAGGAVLGLVGLGLGEAHGFRVADVTLKSALAVAYLIVFGSLIAYSAYVWLVRVTSPARLGTYAYVNPVIALFLGWALADEPISFRSAVAATIIIASVIVIVSEGRGSGARGVAGRTK